MNIVFDEDLLEHDIIDVDGIVILCPRLLASDVAHEVYIDWCEVGNVPTNYVLAKCRDKLDKIISEMMESVEEILEDNDMGICSAYKEVL